MSDAARAPVDLSRAQTAPALLASLAVVAADEPLPQSAIDALRWLVLIWSEGHDDIPLFLVHDLGHLLVRGRDLRFTSSRAVSTWGDEERAVRLAYEDRVVARWATEPSVVEAHIAVAGMPATLRDRAVAHAVSLALAPVVRDLNLPHGNPAHVRALLETADLHAAVASSEALRARVDDVWMQVMLDVMTRCQPLLAGRRVFTDADLWDIAHLPDVPSESARRALREVHAASSLVGPAAPGSLLVLRRAPDVALEDDEADTYPTGGFDAVSTKGSFENLVRSEVAYVGAGVDTGTEGGRPVDLFDLRFAENELLYYTRDESPLLEERRIITLAVDGVAELRHKLPELPAQTLVMVLGICVRLQADLVQGLGPMGSFVTISLSDPSGSAEHVAVVQEELALLSLSLRAELAHRRAQLVAAKDPLAVEARRRVVFSPRPPPSMEVPGLVCWVRVGGRVWKAWFGRRPEQGLDVDAADATALRALGDKILSLT